MNNLRDHILHAQNQLFFKICSFSVTEVVEDVMLMFEECARIKRINFVCQIDLPESLQLIYSDQERVPP